MPVNIKGDDGEEKTLYTPEEYQDLERQKGEFETKAQELERLNAEKTQNFKKLNDMTEAERAKFSAKEIENMKRMEATETELATTKERLAEKEQNEITSKRSAAFARFAGSDAELLKKIQENYDLLEKLDETNPETFKTRVEKAAQMSGITTQGFNPINSYWEGAAPSQQKPKDSKEEFMKSERAKDALKAMGDKVE